MIKATDLVFIRTTEEPVVVLRVDDTKETSEFPDLSGLTVLVRRPVQGEKGLFHVTERFHVEELATNADMRMAEAVRFNEARSAAKKSLETQKADASAPPDVLIN